MTKREKEQLEKFKKFTNWMCADISRTMFCANANFLVAQALVNYTETLGSFLYPYKENKSGIWMLNKKGEPEESYSRDRFLLFFSA